MKLNIIILLIFIISVSCYQAPESSSGSVAVKINTDLMRGAPAGYDGVLRLAVFGENDLDSIVDISSNPDISYQGDFPPALLANNLVPIQGRSGEVSLLNVPSDTKLKLLVERDGQEYYSGSEFTGDFYFHSHSGLSNTFEVDGGKTVDVIIDLVPTTDGTVSFVSSVYDYDMFYELLDADDFNSLVTISGGDIDYNPSATDSVNLYSENIYSGVTNPVTLDALPGKKLRILISEYSYPGSGDIGVTDEFELQPGRTLTVSVSYYNFIGGSGVY